MKRKTDQETLVPGYARRAATATRKKLRVPKWRQDPTRPEPATRGRREERRREALELDWNFPPSRRPLSPHPVPVERWPCWGAAQESTHTCLSGMESRTRLSLCRDGRGQLARLLDLFCSNSIPFPRAAFADIDDLFVRVYQNGRCDAR